MRDRRRRSATRAAALSLALSFASTQAEAAPLDGAHLSLWWAFAFLGLLASIGLGPLIAERLWHRHYGKIAFLWAAGLSLALGCASATKPRSRPSRTR